MKFHDLDDHGDIVLSRHLYARDTIVSQWIRKSDSLIKETVYKEGKTITVYVGNCLTKILRYENNNKKGESFYRYDSLGNPESERHFTIDGNDYKEIKTFVGAVPCYNCRYEYDRKGNWIAAYLLLEEKQIKYARRKITYY